MVPYLFLVWLSLWWQFVYLQPVDMKHWVHHSGVIMSQPDGASYHRRLEYLLNRLFRRRSKRTSKLYVTVLYEGNPPVSGEFPSQRASKTETVSIWWHHANSTTEVAQSRWRSFVNEPFRCWNIFFHAKGCQNNGYEKQKVARGSPSGMDISFLGFTKISANS